MHHLNDQQKRAPIFEQQEVQTPLIQQAAPAKIHSFSSQKFCKGLLKTDYDQLKNQYLIKAEYH